MSGFEYQDIFQHSETECEYYRLDTTGVSTSKACGREILNVSPEVLSQLARQAVIDVSHLQRGSHLEALKKILDDPSASENDRYVAWSLLENAVISSGMEFPGCQDTGTVIVHAMKGENVFTGANDAEAISRGIWQAYNQANLRFSQIAPLTTWEEENTGTNLPAQIDISAVPGGEYKFLFITKGGGSANKTFMFPESKSILKPERFMSYLREKIPAIGTSACPPYHLAIVIGGTSPEANLKTVKLASARYYDGLPDTGSRLGRAFRDRVLEQDVLEMTQQLGIGAQFGGKYFCHDVRVIRLPRHGASCFIGIGVSCSADRNIRAKITADGVFIERLETEPAKYLPSASALEISSIGAGAVKVDLEEGMDSLRRTLNRYPVGTELMLNGRIVVARDIAHARIARRLENGEGLPSYMKDHIVYYAGPAKTPEGYASGSFGPTTAGRMDPYVPLFQKEGGSLVMLAKGNRSSTVVDSCREHGGFFLGSIGGAAAFLGRDCITDVRLIEYPELGMEAVYIITVKDFPAFIIIDDKGNDFFQQISAKKTNNLYGQS